MIKISDLRLKEVINIIDGKRLGVIKDIELDLEIGKVKALVLPGSNRLMSFFWRNEDVVVPWDKIRTIGVDVILVEIHSFTELNHPSLK
jgi:YlmC/YmxH family sporulation protein